MEEPEEVIHLISEYPQIKPMYEEVYQLCLNTEKIMGLFSKELQILDENTVQYMMDEMQDTINEKQSTINEMRNTIDGMQEQLGVKDDIIVDKEAAIQALQERIEELESEHK